MAPRLDGRSILEVIEMDEIPTEVPLGGVTVVRRMIRLEDEEEEPFEEQAQSEEEEGYDQDEELQEADQGSTSYHLIL